MSCDFDYSVRHSYFDSELTLIRAAEFKLHLADCSDCADEMAALGFVRGSLKYPHLYEAAPASLKRKIHADLYSIRPTTRRPLLLSWRGLAVAAALFLVVLILWRVIPGMRKEEDYQAEFAAGIVDAHLRSLLPGQLTTVSSSDPQTVSTWFEGKVKFVIPVRNLADDGFALQGGRLDAVQGRTVAALVYPGRDQLFNAFIFSTREPDDLVRSGSRQGYHWTDWRQHKLALCT